MPENPAEVCAAAAGAGLVLCEHHIAKDPQNDAESAFSFQGCVVYAATLFRGFGKKVGVVCRMGLL